MEERLVEDLAVFRAVNSRHRDMRRVCDAALCKWPDDYDWFRDKVGGGRRLYNKLAAGYRPGLIGYLGKGLDQIERLMRAFSEAEPLEADVRARLYRAASGADTDIIGGKPGGYVVQYSGYNAAPGVFTRDATSSAAAESLNYY
jgi:hypothetical protein